MDFALSPELPALLGGAPVWPQGPPAWPPADSEVLEALQAAYHDRSWGSYHGGRCAELEEALRTYHGIDHVLLCGSGTFAVELGLRALNVGPGDEVMMAAYDYGGNFLAVHAVGASPILVDVEPHNWNLSLERVREGRGDRVKAVIASHLHGGIVPMRALMEWTRSCGIAVIEDAAHCAGATIEDKAAGTWGDIGVLSFGGSKLLSSGRGGALLTSSALLYQRARTHAFRGNLVCPLSELQATVLLPQVRKLDIRNRERAASVRTLAGLLASVPGLVPFRNVAAGEPGYYKVGIQFDAEQFGLARTHLLAALRAEGIAMDEGFRALHVGRSAKSLAFSPAELTEAEYAHAGCIILHHPVLLGGDDAMLEIARALHKIRNYRQKLAAVIPRLGTGESA